MRAEGPAAASSRASWCSRSEAPLLLLLLAARYRRAPARRAAARRDARSSAYLLDRGLLDNDALRARVDRGCKVTDKDADAAFVIFECPAGRRSRCRAAPPRDLPLQSTQGTKACASQVTLPDERHRRPSFAHARAARAQAPRRARLATRAFTRTKPAPPPPVKHRHGHGRSCHSTDRRSISAPTPSPAPRRRCARPWPAPRSATVMSTAKIRTVNALAGGGRGRPLGKEAGLFTPSGTMANQIAVHGCTRTPSEEVLVSEGAHLMLLYESGAGPALSGRAAHRHRQGRRCSRGRGRRCRVQGRQRRTTRTTRARRRREHAQPRRRSHLPAGRDRRDRGDRAQARPVTTPRRGATVERARSDGHPTFDARRAVRHGIRLSLEGPRRTGGLGAHGWRGGDEARASSSQDARRRHAPSGHPLPRRARYAFAHHIVAPRRRSRQRVARSPRASRASPAWSPSIRRHACRPTSASSISHRTCRSTPQRSFNAAQRCAGSCSPNSDRPAPAARGHPPRRRSRGVPHAPPTIVKHLLTAWTVAARVGIWSSRRESFTVAREIRAERSATGAR